MPSRSYVAQRLGAFAELVQASTLAGFRLDALPPASVHDTYYDTPDGGLLTEGLQLRVREQDGGAVAALQGLDGAPVEVDVALATAPRRGAPLVPPHGPLLDALQTALALAPGDRERLDPLVSLRQYRTPRVAYDGARLVGLLSFDVVVVENVGDSQGTNELEVDHAIPAPDLARLDPVLRAAGLVAEPRSKYERALLRLRRDENEALLLLPRERELLQQIAEGGEPTARRRARVILLSSRGYGAGTVAAQTGLNAARVLHWKRLFLEHRLGMVGGAAPPPGFVSAVHDLRDRARRGARPSGVRAELPRPRRWCGGGPDRAAPTFADGVDPGGRVARGDPDRRARATRVGRRRAWRDRLSRRLPPGSDRHAPAR